MHRVYQKNPKLVWEKKENEWKLRIPLLELLGTGVEASFKVGH